MADGAPTSEVTVAAVAADGADLPRAFLKSCLLLLLRERPAHGYELVRRLDALGLAGVEPGSLYRSLRTLEQSGLVRSSWAPAASGHERRVYELTRGGMEELHSRARGLSGTRALLEVFLSRYSEFAAVTPQREL